MVVYCEITMVVLDVSSLVFFFFQAEDGIRDLTVTGVQTCALPISALVQKVADGGVDLALLPVFAAPDDIVVTKIACEALVVACAASHPLAGRGDVTLERLAREPFVDFQPDWGTRPLVDSAFRQAGIERRIAFE